MIEGSPWSFNRKALVIARMRDGEIPRGVSLNTIDLWVQIHELRAGFMTERIVKEVGNYIGVFVESCARNFIGVWKEYLRVRVTIDLSKPLKRRMKIGKAGDVWDRILFKYENVPTFCFICGLIGHSEKYCNCLFEKSETEIEKPYGVWMRAPFRRQTKLIGAKWLRDGGEDTSRNTVDGKEKYQEREDNSVARNQGQGYASENYGGSHYHHNDKGTDSGFSNSKDQCNKPPNVNADIIIIENKKRKTDNGLDQNIELGKENTTKVGLPEETTEMDHDLDNISDNILGSKNVEKAGSGKGVRLSK